MKKIILLVGVLDDPVLVYIAKYLIKAKLNLVFLDQNKMGTNLFCDVHGWYYLAKNLEVWRIEHKNIIAVYNRIAAINYQHSNLLEISLFETLLYLLNTTYPNVINRPNAAMSNFSKLGQLMEIKRKHLLIPQSTILAHSACKEKNMIYKSASNQRSIVKSVTKNLPYGAEPVLYQQKIKGDNYRVHVFNNSCFAIRIKANKIDYRYDKSSRFSAIKLPLLIQQECIAICLQLNFIFSGIDLIFNQKKWYLLEANPSPGFDFFERKTNSLKLTNAIIAYFKGL